MPWPVEKNGLTPKQNIFIKEYVHGEKPFNSAHAARQAGYSTDTAYAIGSENLNKPHIAQQIRREIQSIRDRLDDNYVLETIERLLKKAEEEGQLNNALKAVELIGKINKMFVDRVEISASYEDQLDSIPSPKGDVIDAIPENEPEALESPETPDKGE